MAETKYAATRRLLPQQAVLTAAALVTREATAAEPAWKHLFSAGFRNERIKTSGAEINAVIGGFGPPVLCILARHQIT